jgi:hypothetical protein
MNKVLLTGSAGHIGTSLRQQLRGVYHFRCLECVEKVIVWSNVAP